MRQVKLLFVTTLFLVLFFSTTPSLFAANTFNESFNYPDNTSPAIGWINTSRIYNPNQVNVDQVLNNDGTIAKWFTENGQYKIHITNKPYLTAVRSEPINFPINSHNISLEFDMNTLNGVSMDRGIMFRYVDGIHYYLIHTVDSNIRLGKADMRIGELDNEIIGGRTNYPFEGNQTYHFKIDQVNTSFKVYINGQLIIDATDTGNVYTDGKIALNATVGGAYGGDVWFDNIKVTEISDNNSSALPVPLVKQIDPLWRGKVYDSATSWAPNSPTIGSWGCAMTSAVMVFNYHGLTKMPDGSLLNPDTVNSWLKSQPDGYVGTGWVNWLALSRLSKKAKSTNPTFTKDALEYKRFSGANKTQLTADLNNNLPDILQVPGHFIAATGIAGDTFSINDPYYERNTLTSYNNTFSNLGRYTPSNTDLSYLMFTTDKDTNIIVKDASGNTVGESYLEDPYDNDEVAGQKNGETFRVFLLEKPDLGNYNISLSSNTTHSYKLESYLYDKNGEVIVKTNTGIVSQSPEELKLDFNKDDLTKVKLASNTTFDSMIMDIRELQANQQIKNRVDDTLIFLVSQAKYAYNIGLRSHSITILNATKKLFIALRGHGVSTEAYNILLNDANSLISSLR